MANEVDIYKNAEITIRNAQGIYLDHESRLTKALAAGNNFLEVAETSGMTDDMYENATIILNKYAATINNFKEERKVVTDFIQNVVKSYTGQENLLDVKKEGTVAYKLFEHMNKFVAKKEAERRERERIEKLKIQHEADIREVKVSVQTNIDLSFVEFKQDFSKRMQGFLSRLTLENQADVKRALIDAPSWPPHLAQYTDIKDIIAIIVGKVPRYSLTQAELDEIVSEYTSSPVFKNRVNDYESYCVSEQQTYVGKFVSRVRELNEMKLAGEEAQKRLLAQKQREDEDALRIIEQSARMERQAVKENEDEKREMISAQADFDSGTATAAVATDYKKIEGYKISLILPGGMIPVVKFWVSKQVAPITMDQIETLSFSRMIAFAEKQAKKTGEMIESEFVKYTEIVKAKF